MPVWESIASLARLAPTPHNTQPFRILPRNERTADLVALTARFLPREDHGNLYVGSAFGIFAATVERAARQFGHVLTVAPAADVDPAALTERGPIVTLGQATITGTCEPDPQFPLLDARRTSRLPYHDRIDRSEGARGAHHGRRRIRSPVHRVRRPRGRQTVASPQRRSRRRQPPTRRRTRRDPRAGIASAKRPSSEMGCGRRR